MLLNRALTLQKGLYQIDFFLQNITDKKLPDEILELKFDTVISTEVIEHLFDPKSFILFCKEMLARNIRGHLILSTPYHGYLKNLSTSLLNNWNTHLVPLLNGGHIKFWSWKSMILTTELKTNI